MTDEPQLDKPVPRGPRSPFLPKKQNRHGRKSCMDEQMQSNFCAVLATGCSMKTAANYIGCHVITVYRAMSRLPEFAEAVRKAQGRCETRWLTRLEDASHKGDAGSTKWLLSRCFPTAAHNKPAEAANQEQTAVVLARYTDILIKEVTLQEDRLRINARINEMLASMTKESAVILEMERDT